MPEPPVLDLPDLPIDDVALTPWVQSRHMGGPSKVTVVHDTDRTPYVVRLGSPEDTVAAVIQASCELMDFTEQDVCVLDCSSGSDLAFGHLAAGLCLWINRHPVILVDLEQFAPVKVSPTIPWDAEDVGPQDQASSAATADNLPVSSTATRDAPVLEPLASLDAERLPLVTEPSVADFALMQALRTQTMSPAARKQILANQGTIWPDDELCFHMNQMLAASKKPTWALIDPLLCAEAVKRPSTNLICQWFKSLSFKPTAILAGCMHQSALDSVHLDLDYSSRHCFELGRAWVSTSGVVRVAPSHCNRSCVSNLHCPCCAAEVRCGPTLWIRFIDNMLRGKMLPTSHDEAFQVRATGRSLFVTPWIVHPAPGFLGSALTEKLPTGCTASRLTMESTSRRSRLVPPC